RIHAEQNARRAVYPTGLSILIKLLPLLLCGAAFGAPAETVTFNGQIAAIIYKNCSWCHRPGEAAPFSLLSYQDVAKRGKLIAAATTSRFMPPWKAEPASYGYRDERRLTEGEIALLAQWVKQGMPEGSHTNAP